MVNDLEVEFLTTISPPTLLEFIFPIIFQYLVLEPCSLEKESFVALRKDLDDGSLQIGKDY